MKTQRNYACWSSNFFSFLFFSICFFYIFFFFSIQLFWRIFLLFSFFFNSAAANIFTIRIHKPIRRIGEDSKHELWNKREQATEKSKLLICMEITSSPNLFERMVCMLMYAQWRQNKVKWIRSVSWKSPKWQEQKCSPINYNESMSMTPNTTQHNLETAIGFYDRSMALSHIKGFRLRSLTQQILT